MPHRAPRRRFGLAARLTILLGVVAGLGVLVMGIYVSRTLEALAVARLQGTLVTHAGLLHDAFVPLSTARPVGRTSRDVPSAMRGFSGRV